MFSIQFGGVHPRTVRNFADGTFDVGELEAKIRVNKRKLPETRLVWTLQTRLSPIIQGDILCNLVSFRIQVCIENTHNFLGGRALPTSFIQEVRSTFEFTLPLNTKMKRINFLT